MLISDWIKKGMYTWYMCVYMRSGGYRQYAISAMVLWLLMLRSKLLMTGVGSHSMHSQVYTNWVW